MAKLTKERRAQLDELVRRGERGGDGALPARRDPAGPIDPIDPIDRMDDRDAIVSIFSGAHRKGSWEPPEVLSVFSLFGGVHLDYCEADLLEGRSEIKVLSLFGGVHIVVPPDVHVETRGLGIFGNFSHLQQRAEEEDAPVLRVTGLALFGGVDVRCKRESWVKRRLRRR